jgi:hypothetical protein
MRSSKAAIMPEKQSIESPSELGDRFRRELRELVDLGEISPSVAQRVLDDLFEPDATAGGGALRWSVWLSYVEELTGRAATGAGSP